MQLKYDILEHYFGYSSFREGQEPLIDSILNGRDALGVMPTGAGKSLCFQIPALMLSGITLVVSPLISLMKDQVHSLTQNGVRAAYLNSSLTPAQYRTTLHHAREGAYQLIYVAPERLNSAEFQDFAVNSEIAMVTIDEAHCASQWGQDFRPGYLAIPRFIEVLPKRPVVSAFTATATPRVREDILSILELQDPFVLLTGFDRKNLYYEVRKPSNKMAAVLALMQEMTGKSGVIYCATRKNVEEVCEELCKNGIAATRYHAGLTDVERRENQDDFLFDRKPVMVATNAFGMGIDKSNVFFVIHYNMPKDLESYYQEAGRAGRDGTPARCILLYSGQDVVTNKFLISRSEENESMSPEQFETVSQQNQERLRTMTFYCHTTDCLRAYMLRYFGETAPDFCGNCGNCNRPTETLDITIPAQKILSCIKRTGERYGMKLIIDILRGAKTERIRRLGLERQTTYGLMSDTSEKRMREIFHFLILENYINLTEGEYPILQLGSRAADILVRRVSLRFQATCEDNLSVPPKRRTHTKDPISIQNPALFEQLRQLRTQIAAEQGLPSYLIFSNATLQEMSALLPCTREALLAVSGVGQRKLEQYGDRFLAVIRPYAEGSNIISSS